jgi:hypothetical protein
MKATAKSVNWYDAKAVQAKIPMSEPRLSIKNIDKYVTTKKQRHQVTSTLQLFLF